MHVEPKPARFQVDNAAEGLRVSIPARRQAFLLLILMAWIGGWAVGWINAAGQVMRAADHEPSAFLTFWLLGWTVGGF
jgi:hypothetical protein